jgi:hypothetical protein
MIVRRADGGGGGGAICLRYSCRIIVVDVTTPWTAALTPLPSPPSAGQHYAVDTAGSTKAPCEQCLARQLGEGGQFTPTYVWNGENYLLKVLCFFDASHAYFLWLAARNRTSGEGRARSRFYVSAQLGGDKALGSSSDLGLWRSPQP